MTSKESKESNEEDINFGKKKIEFNFDYLSNIQKDYSNINKETKSGIPGIFILFEKVSDYFSIEYNLNKCNKEIQNLKFNEEKVELISKLKDFIEKETLIPNIFEKDKSLLKLICYDLYLFMFISFKNKILDSTLDINITDYNSIFSLIKIISEIELNVDVEINKNSLDIFYSLFYFLLRLKKEIYHLLETYLYISIKFQENNYIKENEFYDLFIKKFFEKKEIYTKKDSQDLISIYLFSETIFQILNTKSIEVPSIIFLFKNIVPEFVVLYESLNLNGKEIYTFIELMKVVEILRSYNNGYIINIFKLILEASNFELSKHLNIYLNQQESDKIMLLSENIKEIKNEEANTLYNNLKEILKEICKNINNDVKYKLIVEIFTQELKKYNNNYYYFIILRNLLLLNKGETFKYSKDIFEIILKKYLFQKCPQEQKDIDEFFEQIGDENNPFIINYFFIVENEKLKVFLEEIILQIFGFHLNGYFMKYTDKINDVISYKNLDKNLCKKIFEENLEFLKASIKFLEEIKDQNYKKKILASLFCCNFIQIYFYHLVKYIYENKDENIDELYDYSHIIQIIDGEEDKQTTPFRFSIKILFMRLLYYNFGKRNNSTFENFKKFDFDGRKITFREQFKGDKKFEDSIPKLINFSKIFLEDYQLDKTWER